MTAKDVKPITGLCPWCGAEVVAVGICLVDGQALDSCPAFKCDVCDTYLDCLGLPIRFDRVVFDIPGIQNCRFP
ncbi:MAG: hypothetical protein MUC48_03600 [Leptolyngbya sp. Prado105]|jgi:hypothetical protein|nr:hypothetical protein [Leptolyngbya sp. Prado105]